MEIEPVFKLLFGVTALIVLAFINNNIHQLVDCFLQTQLEQSAVSPKCSTQQINEGLDIRIEQCPDEISIYLNEAILRSIHGPDTPEFVHWLDNCYPNATLCPSFANGVSRHLNSSLYYTDTRFDYLCIDGFLFSHTESVAIITFLR